MELLSDGQPSSSTHANAPTSIPCGPQRGRMHKCVQAAFAVARSLTGLTPAVAMVCRRKEYTVLLVSPTVSVDHMDRILLRDRDGITVDRVSAGLPCTRGEIQALRNLIRLYVLQLLELDPIGIRTRERYVAAAVEKTEE